MWPFMKAWHDRIVISLTKCLIQFQVLRAKAVREISSRGQLILKYGIGWEICQPYKMASRSNVEVVVVAVLVVLVVVIGCLFVIVWYLLYVKCSVIFYVKLWLTYICSVYVLLLLYPLFPHESLILSVEITINISLRKDKEVHIQWNLF